MAVVPPYPIVTVTVPVRRFGEPTTPPPVDMTVISETSTPGGICSVMVILAPTVKLTSGPQQFPPGSDSAPARTTQVTGLRPGVDAVYVKGVPGVMPGPAILQASRPAVG